jgi:hypothetical protein
MLLFSFCIVLIFLFQIESITTIITNQDNVFESYKPLKVISRLSS